jgi:hypothetical protein
VKKVCQELNDEKNPKVKVFWQPFRFEFGRRGLRYSMESAVKAPPPFLNLKASLELMLEDEAGKSSGSARFL